MFVVEVCTLRVPSALRMSDGSPDRSSVIASNDAHVFAAYSLSWRSPPAMPAAGGSGLPRRDQHERRDERGHTSASHELPLRVGRSHKYPDRG